MSTVRNNLLMNRISGMFRRIFRVRMAPTVLLVTLLAGACIPAIEPTPLPEQEAIVRDPALPAEDFVLWRQCTQDEARQWAEQGTWNAGAAVRAAGCYAALALMEEDRQESLEHARRGGESAESAAVMVPESALAHYLVAYLAGLTAERDPLRGLELIPVIERHAERAAELNPIIDDGGPHRMLGELYLQAPGFPLSIGDSERAVEHFRQAVVMAPAHPENRLGLAEALLATDDREEACRQLQSYFAGLDVSAVGWARGVELLGRMCGE